MCAFGITPALKNIVTILPVFGLQLLQRRISVKTEHTRITMSGLVIVYDLRGKGVTV